MCGIGAIITLSGSQIPSASIQKMMTLMKHRGPDDEGFLCHVDPAEPILFGGTDSPPGIWTSTFPQSPRMNISDDNNQYGVMLGHRRLSIVDLSVAGHQPLCSEDKRHWIVYNGEVYNFREIRDELITLGHSFYSDSDTEVILKSYIAWGTDCLSRFNGMWGFVIYDSQEQVFFIARDRFGVKPVYYWFSDSGFLAFASEIKGFTALPGWKAVVNESRAYDFLVNGLLDHTNETLFSGVQQLRRGHYLHFSRKNIRDIYQVEWYIPKAKNLNDTDPSLVEQFHDLLKDAVGIRMRADVPVGSCLSGGLDSSSIVRIAQELIQSSGSDTVQKTFSASFHDQRWSEKKYSDIVISETPIEPHYIYPSCEELLSVLEHLIWHQDEPFISTSIFSQWCVFQSAKEQGIKVMLDGQGADEILYGYTDFVYAIGSNLIKTGDIWQFYREAVSASKKLNLSPLHVMLRMFYYLLPDSFRLFFAENLFRRKYKPIWINLPLFHNISMRKSLSYIPISSDPIQLSLKTLLFTSLPMLLHFEDRNSMAHSIESRVPFTDFRIVELSLSLPSRLKWIHGISKFILRESMRGILPETVRTRQDKMGFVTPEEIWIVKEYPDQFRNLLMAAVKETQGLITDTILSDFNQVQLSQRPYNHLFWRIIVFGQWMKVFKVKREE